LNIFLLQTGKVNTDIIFAYTSPTIFDGRWTLTSGIEGAKDLRVSVKTMETGDLYQQHLVVGWDLLKEIVLDSSVQMGDDPATTLRIPGTGEPISDKLYRGTVALTTPFESSKQVGVQSCWRFCFNYQLSVVSSLHA
jgi:hypothetical protein